MDCIACIDNTFGGSERIRTSGTRLRGPSVFETGALNLSATLPLNYVGNPTSSTAITGACRDSASVTGGFFFENFTTFKFGCFSAV